MCAWSPSLALEWCARSQGDGRLVITLNNSQERLPINAAPLAAAQWTVVACSVTVAAARKVVKVALNGQLVESVDLRGGVQIDAPERDKNWAFADYGEGTLVTAYPPRLT